MVLEPNRTPGKAEGADKPEDMNSQDDEPGRTPEQAEGGDPESEEQAREQLKQSMQQDQREKEARSRDVTPH